jgi:hypothetical protein
LPLFFFFINMLHLYFNVQYTNGNIFGYLYTNQTYIFFSYEIAEFQIDENSRPRKQARLDTFLIPRRDEKSQR